MLGIVGNYYYYYYWIIREIVEERDNSSGQNSMLDLLSLNLLPEMGLNENAIGDHETLVLYETRYPVIYLNKYTTTHIESFY